MEYRNLSDLVKNKDNPRIIKDKNFQTLKQSIKNNPKYFEARPIILSDRSGELVIIAGNQRYEAAKSLGLEKVPTFLISGLDENQEKEIMIRDNVNNGEWDWGILANQFELSDLSELGVGVFAMGDENKEIDVDKLIDEKNSIICPKCKFEFEKK